MMLAPGDTQAPVIESRDELVMYFEQGAKPKAEWRIGRCFERSGSCSAMTSGYRQ